MLLNARTESGFFREWAARFFHTLEHSVFRVAIESFGTNMIQDDRYIETMLKGRRGQQEDADWVEPPSYLSAHLLMKCRDATSRWYGRWERLARCFNDQGNSDESDKYAITCNRDMVENVAFSKWDPATHYHADELLYSTLRTASRVARRSVVDNKDNDNAPDDGSFVAFFAGYALDLSLMQKAIFMDNHFSNPVSQQLRDRTRKAVQWEQKPSGAVPDEVVLIAHWFGSLRLRLKKFLFTKPRFRAVKGDRH
jgi:hypothetical protein